jgi:hypothetical protein
MLVQVRKHLSKMAGVDVLEWEESVTALLLHVSQRSLALQASLARSLSPSLSPSHLDTMAGCQMCVRL